MMRSRTIFHNTSNPILGLAIVFLAAASIGEAATFYVAKTGSDSSSGSSTTPFRTINKGVSTLRPGDTLYIKSGTYAEWLNNTIPAGTSWSAPVTVAAFPGDTVTIQPAAGSNFAVILEGSSKQYIVLDNLILDGVNVKYKILQISRPAVGAAAAHHIRVKNCELKNSKSTAIFITYRSDYNEFLNLRIHNCGKAIDAEGLYGYAFYLKGSNNLIEGCDIFDIGHSGIQIYSATAGTEPPVGNIIRKNRIYNNTVMSGPLQGRGQGITVAAGSRHLIYDNTVRNNHMGIYLSYSSNNKVYSNTVSYNSSTGIFISAGSYGASITNNRVYGNGYGQIMNYGSGTIISNNLYTP